MTLRLSDDDERALQALAEERGVSKQAAIVAAIHEAAARGSRQRLVEAADVVVGERYEQVLARLRDL